MKRSKHQLSNYRLLTCDMGQLIPVGLQEALPGDTFQLSTSALIRCSPLAAPVMHPVAVRIHHFFVPHRLLWPQWEDFITGGPDGRNTDTIPQVHVPTPATIKGTLWDYLGMPPNTGVDAVQVSALPLRGINMIWNEYYRDQDLQVERAEDDATLPKVAWGKDYFTSARPWTQKGPEITLPLGNQAPVVGLGTAASYQFNLASQQVRESTGSSRTYANSAAVSSSSPNQAMLVEENSNLSGFPGVYADLSKAGQISINDFRRGFALQRYEEARARYGSRYTEYLRYLGVTPSDARLQRPEYLGGGTGRISFSEVLQTAAATRPDGDATFGVGDLFGHGIAGVRSGRVRRFIEEHGYIHSFMSVRPKSIYMNGIERTFLRKTKEDFFQKELAQIGQEELYALEIYAAGARNGEVFGYQDRYRSYKETHSQVQGEFRDTLNFWHLGRDLPQATVLNKDFVECTPSKRIYNVQTGNVLWCMVQNHVVARRMVPRSASSRVL